MRKIASFLLGIVFLACALPAFVLADTTDSTGSTQPTEPTPGLEFDFDYREFSYDYIDITLSKETDSGFFVEYVKIGNTEIPIVDDNTGCITDVYIGDIPPGVYDISLIMNDGTSITTEKEVVRGGELEVDISLKAVDNRLSATVLDNHGRPIAGVEVIFNINNQKFDTGKTDENGEVLFSYRLPSDTSGVHCVVEDFEKSFEPGITINYKGAVVWLEEKPHDTTTTSRTGTTTTSTTRTGKTNKPATENKTTPSTSKATLPIITGAGTTGIVGDMIAVNVSFDTGVQKSFDYTAKDIAARARLLMHKDSFKYILGDTASSMMLLLQTSSFEITDHHISAAISGKSKYSLFHADETLRIPLELSMQIVNSTLHIDTPVSLSNTEVTIELPVPKSMRKTSKYTVTAAAFDENGKLQLFDTTVKDGIMSFKTNGLTPVVILGFAKPSGMGGGGGTPALAVALIIFGILMLGGAVTLLYFFFLRKPVPEPAEQAVSDIPQLPEIDLSSVGDSVDTDDERFKKGVSLGDLLNKSDDDK